jgi:hypothetical protein
MGRWLVDVDPIFAAEQRSHEEDEARRAERRKKAGREPATRNVANLETYMHEPETTREMQERITTRSLAWVLGTSIAFELVVLALAGFIFSRRDF